MPKYSPISARILICGILPKAEGYRLKFSKLPDLPAVFVNDEGEARFFGETWEKVVNQVIQFIKTK